MFRFEELKAKVSSQEEKLTELEKRIGGFEDELKKQWNVLEAHLGKIPAEEHHNLSEIEKRVKILEVKNDAQRTEMHILVKVQKEINTTLTKAEKSAQDIMRETVLGDVGCGYTKDDEGNIELDPEEKEPEDTLECEHRDSEGEDECPTCKPQPEEKDCETYEDEQGFTIHKCGKDCKHKSDLREATIKPQPKPDPYPNSPDCIIPLKVMSKEEFKKEYPQPKEDWMERIDKKFPFIDGRWKDDDYQAWWKAVKQFISEELKTQREELAKLSEYDEQMEGDNLSAQYELGRQTQRGNN